VNEKKMNHQRMLKERVGNLFEKISIQLISLEISIDSVVAQF
jgi:hypothetical protein